MPITSMQVKKSLLELLRIIGKGGESYERTIIRIIVEAGYKKEAKEAGYEKLLERMGLK